jgi:putative transcriptional regulator
LTVKKKLFAELVQSVKEMQAIRRGEMKPSRVFEVPEPDARAIRSRFKLSQSQFASLLGISVGTLRNWEQGLRRPEGPARVLLHVVELHPDAVREASIPRTLTKGGTHQPLPKRVLSGSSRASGPRRP